MGNFPSDLLFISYNFCRFFNATAFLLLLPIRQQTTIVIRVNTNANIFAIVEPILATKSIINGTPNAL
jgi:type IV secretory pathway component VirB8